MIVPLLVVGIILFITSLVDLRTREVPDWLSHALILFGICVGITSTVVQQNWQPFWSMLAGLGIGFIIALFMYYAGQWGGGDSKLIIGVATVFGVWIRQYDLFTFIANLFLIGALYGLAWSIGLAVKHRKQFVPAFRKYIRQPRIVTLRVFVLVIILFLFILMLFTWHSPYRVMLFAILAATYIFFYLLLFVKVLEKSVMTRATDINKLTEGDWIAQNVYYRKKRLCGPKDLGVNRQQLLVLKKLRKQKKLRTVMMKSGIPFVPSFFLAYIAYFVYGNWFPIILTIFLR